MRLPGQSVDASLQDFVLDKMLMPIVLALVFVILAVMEWFRYLRNTPLMPWLFTFLALLSVAWATWKVRGAMKIARQMKQGRDGERLVAQYLEHLRKLGFAVFHDVPNGDSNIDHVLIGPQGIYSVETKTLSKPERGECRITVSADGIRLNGNLLDRNPLIQAKAQARWLYSFFAETGYKPFIQPVVVFPGWFVEPHDRQAVGVWVLEPKALEGFIANSGKSIPSEEIRAMASALTSYVHFQAAA